MLLGRKNIYVSLTLLIDFSCMYLKRTLNTVNASDKARIYGHDDYTLLCNTSIESCGSNTA